MSACEVTIEGVNGHGPFVFEAPSLLKVFGRSTLDCTTVTVEVKLPDGTPVFAGTAATTPAQVPADNPLKHKWSASFPPPLGLYVVCGAELEVHARCPAGPCEATATVPVTCKPAPEPISFPNLCYWLALTYTTLLLAACAVLVTGVAIASPLVATLSSVAFAAAGAAWLSWIHMCAPGPCARFGTAAWVFKRATAASLPIVLGAFHIGGPSSALVLLAYGAAAGIAVQGLERHRCRVPAITDALSSIV